MGAVTKNDHRNPKFPPLFDSNYGQKKICKWECTVVALAKWLDERGVGHGVYAV